MTKEQIEVMMNKMADVECELYCFCDRTGDSKYEEVRAKLRETMELLHSMTK